MSVGKGASSQHILEWTDPPTSHRQRCPGQDPPHPTPTPLVPQGQSLPLDRCILQADHFQEKEERGGLCGPTLSSQTPPTPRQLSACTPRERSEGCYIGGASPRGRRHQEQSKSISPPPPPYKWQEFKAQATGLKRACGSKKGDSCVKWERGNI